MLAQDLSFSHSLCLLKNEWNLNKLPMFKQVVVKTLQLDALYLDGIL